MGYRKPSQLRHVLECRAGQGSPMAVSKGVVRPEQELEGSWLTCPGGSLRKVGLGGGGRSHLPQRPPPPLEAGGGVELGVDYIVYLCDSSQFLGHAILRVPF